MRPITREDLFLEFQMNRLIDEIKVLQSMLKKEEPAVEEPPVVEPVRGDKVERVRNGKPRK